MSRLSKLSGVSFRRWRSWQIAPIILATAFFSGPAAMADLREDAAYYYRMWRETDARAAAVAASNPFAGLGYVPEIAKWKGLYDRAMAELARQQQAQPEQPAQPQPPPQQQVNQIPPNRGYGPPRTGLDWQPFLADLRPKAVASSIRQGDNFAKNGDLNSAIKDYDLASRIDPKNQLARQKADEAREKLRQSQPQTPVPAQPTPPPLLARPPAPSLMVPGAPPAPSALPQVPLNLPGSQGMLNSGNAPGFHPTQEQLQKRIQFDDESQQSVGSFFKTKAGGN